MIENISTAALMRPIPGIGSRLLLSDCLAYYRPEVDGAAASAAAFRFSLPEENLAAESTIDTIKPVAEKHREEKPTGKVNDDRKNRNSGL